jgi:hypothetical protein
MVYDVHDVFSYQRHSTTIEVAAVAMQVMAADGLFVIHGTLLPGAMSSLGCDVVAAAPAQFSQTSFAAFDGRCTRTKNAAEPASRTGVDDVPQTIVC